MPRISSAVCKTDGKVGMWFGRLGKGGNSEMGGWTVVGELRAGSFSKGCENGGSNRVRD